MARDIKDNELIAVRNRNIGKTFYRTEEGKYRSFEHEEIKKIPFSELTQLTYSNGGRYILENYLVINDEDALELLGMTVQPEYSYTDEDIRKVLFEGSYDEFADFLDFAPKGAIDIAKDMAVKGEIPDTNKRKMLSEKTGLNIDSAILVNKVMAEDGETAEEEAPKQRRVAIKEDKPETKERRTAAPKYNVVSKG